MKIDITSFAFGYKLQEGSNTPNWATALGQGKDHKIINDSAIHEVLKGIIYSSVPLSRITTKIGKGGHVVAGDDPGSPIVQAAVFTKVFVNDEQITDGKFILLITRDDSASHAGRLRLKYGPGNTYTEDGVSFSNQVFFDKVKKQLSMADDACWFVSDISIVEQNQLVLRAIIVDPSNSVSYYNSALLHAEWDRLVGGNSSGHSGSTHPVPKSNAKGGINKIFYGAPGCGKSRHVSDLLDDAGVEKTNRIRVTFHPEYSNYDFIGQILPTVDTDENGKEIVTYVFNPGAFTIALETAYNTGDMVYLIIEEINRGNAAAIFGDMFQLLDRVREHTHEYFSSSEYPVCNPNMQKYLLDHVTDNAVEERLAEGIFIPSNLTILATMNSSDQNVFTLDTAFKRRWAFEQISNDICKDAEHTYKKWYVPGTEVTWESFLTKLNARILEYKVHSQTNEDKRLGKYFITKEYLTEEPQNVSEVHDIAMGFAYKVLEYIWNDVCKIGREDWFDTGLYMTLEDLISAFLEPADGTSPLAIFKNINF